MFIPLSPLGNAADDAVSISMADPALAAEMLEPRLTERPAPCPPIRTPRSAQRSYTHGELCVAADLLAKLRRRDDQRTLADRLTHAAADLSAADHALTVAVDRLLDVL